MAKKPLNKHGFNEPALVRQATHTRDGAASYRPAAYRPDDDDYTVMSPLQIVACTGHFDIFKTDWHGDTPANERAEQQHREAVAIVETRLNELTKGEPDAGIVDHS